MRLPVGSEETAARSILDDQTAVSVSFMLDMRLLSRILFLSALTHVFA